jgi:hypothetical protein
MAAGSTSQCLSAEIGSLLDVLAGTGQERVGCRHRCSREFVRSFDAFHRFCQFAFCSLFVDRRHKHDPPSLWTFKTAASERLPPRRVAGPADNW